MSDHGLPPPPEETRADLAARGAKGVAGAIPLAGGILAEAVDFLWSPLRKRQEDWLLALWLDVRELQERSVLPADDTLVANEAFVSAATHAIRVAARTHQEEKLEALRNAVLNIAAGAAPEEDQHAMYLDAVDSMTVSHVRVLKKLADQDKRSIRPGNHHRGDAIRPPRVEDAMLAQIVRDLKNRGFVEVDTALDQLDARRISGSNVKLTEYGNAFLEFITSPLERQGTSA